jgi:hypothetical protein
MGLYFISFAQNRHEWSTCKTQELGLISNRFWPSFIPLQTWFVIASA